MSLESPKPSLPPCSEIQHAAHQLAQAFLDRNEDVKVCPMLGGLYFVGHPTRPEGYVLRYADTPGYLDVYQLTPSLKAKLIKPKSLSDHFTLTWLRRDHYLTVCLP